MSVIKIKHMRADAVDQRRMQAIGALAAAEDLRLRLTCKRQYRGEHVVDGFVARRADRTAAPVEQCACRFMAHVRGNVCAPRLEDVMREGFGDCRRIRHRQSAFTPDAASTFAHFADSDLI